MINEEKAQEIAMKYIEQSEASVGTPKLKEIENNLFIYTVPILINGDVRGEIHIHSETGENLGGAGC